MSRYEVWVVESREPNDIESPWDIEDVEHGPDAEKRATDRVATENGKARTSLLPRRWRSRCYVPRTA